MVPKSPPLHLRAEMEEWAQAPAPLLPCTSLALLPLLSTALPPVENSSKNAGGLAGTHLPQPNTGGQLG